MPLSQAPYQTIWGRMRGTIAVAALALFLPTAIAVEEMNYEQEIASLEAMVSGERDTAIYELDFEPLNFDRILVRDRLGDNQVFHYLTFRLRNRVADGGDFLATQATVYNEVLDQMVREYGFLRKRTEGGASLVLDDVRALEDERLAVILERESLRVRTRTINLTALVFDEHGTRFRLFDEVPGEGPQEDFNFDDRGLRVAKSDFYLRVQEAIEERYRQRFFSVHDIRGLELPPYNASLPSSFEDGHGMNQGEIFGVIIFDRLNRYGNNFDVHIQGLSNKQRFEWPERLPQGQVEDYFNLRILRRTYVVEMSRRGDEFYRDRNPISMNHHGWRWVERFVRLEQRRAIAYSRFYRHNITLPEPRTRNATYNTINAQGEGVQESTQVSVLHDDRVAGDFWGHYGSIREQWPQRYQSKIDEHQERGQEILAGYQDPEDPRRITDAERQRRADERAAWNAVLERHQELLGDRLQQLQRRLPDWQSTTQERR
ncbi:MAG: hypothetical protein EA401_10340 [Planctomycetota bacterium]|nr:MAG: hypothetical protein EA401_10340 [Planctomycetota bacterium]